MRCAGLILNQTSQKNWSRRGARSHEEKPELHRKLRLLCAGLLWIKSRAEQSGQEKKERITRSYGYLLVLQVPRVLQKILPRHHSSPCVWQMPTSSILNYDNHLSLMFISWLAFLFRGCWSPIQIGCIRKWVCVGMGSLLDIIDLGEERRKIAVKDLWHSFRKHFGMPCTGGWFGLLAAKDGNQVGEIVLLKV